jgi:hypothetical protein
LPHGAAVCDWTGGGGKGRGRKGVRTALWVPLHNQMAVFKSKLLFIVFLYKQFEYSSLKKDSVKEFLTINID